MEKSESTPSDEYGDVDIREKLKLKQKKASRRRGRAAEVTRDKLLSAEEVKAINAQIRETKERLKETIERNKDLVRNVRPESLCQSNVVSIFDSSLTRSLKMSTTEINDQLIIVKVYYFGVAESIIKNGFYIGDEHYIFFSASAGQIRTKKLVAIKESSYKQCEDQLTCGLSQEKINAHGGVNINKYLAYLALCNSATTEWKDFPIEHSIVIDDFETLVHGEVDSIDPATYKIERKEMDIPITHTDGCGMILPKLSQVNFMVRAPWIKGLLSPFAFDSFVREANRKDRSVRHEIIKDIYGVEHNILKENIQIIFTKSQFKMWKYFSNWSEYQVNFRKFGCSAGKCNEEPDRIGLAKFNYQMLQTLTDLSDEELSAICLKTNRKLRDISSDRYTMLQVFGATKPPENLNAFQRSLAYYPELLQDYYCRETLRDLKNSIELQAVAGRLDIDGKYLFLIPDLYAACEYWFNGIQQPVGLIQNGEVYTRQYRRREKLDVLRSPHLYKEHAVRKQIFSKNAIAQKWFITDGIYTSSHDLISRILQFDNDGDKALVCADETIIAAAERNCSDVVPLYYPMAKADAVEITPEAKFDGMVAAWTGGNIGEISNSITKIWNNPNPDLDAIKILCMENNFVIDYAKTLFKPTRPPEWDARIKEAISGRVPRFFIYAKDKEVKQVNDRSQSTVDRLSGTIQSYKFNFQRKQLGKFNYKLLMANPDMEIGEPEEELFKAYLKIARSVGDTRIVITDELNTYVIAVKEMKKTLSQFGDDTYVADVLIKYLFSIKKSVHKAMFWDCYGEVVYQNLLNNKAGEHKMCERCGERFIPMYPNQCICNKCEKEGKKLPAPSGIVTCCDCGREFRTIRLQETRCPVCQWIKDHDVTETTGKNVRKCIICGAPIDTERMGKRAIMCKSCQSSQLPEYKSRKINRYNSRYAS